MKEELEEVLQLQTNYQDDLDRLMRRWSLEYDLLFIDQIGILTLMANILTTNKIDKKLLNNFELQCFEEINDLLKKYMVLGRVRLLGIIELYKVELIEIACIELDVDDDYSVDIF